jgi:hypothetical protein
MTLAAVKRGHEYKIKKKPELSQNKTRKKNRVTKNTIEFMGEEFEAQ